MGKNYLSKLATDPDRRAHTRYRCKAVVRLLYKHSVKRPVASCRALLIDISQTGARLAISVEVPDSFYIIIGNFEYTIGCIVARRDGKSVAVEFVKEQPERLIKAFAILSFPMAPLSSLSNLMYNRMTNAGEGARTEF